MKKGFLIVVATILLGSIGTTSAGKKDSVVNIRNDSDWAIHELYISSTDDDEWGVDQLHRDVIDSNGGRFQLQGIPCNTYDVQIVDEDGDACVVNKVRLCADRDVWRITNDDLLTCQVNTD